MTDEKPSPVFPPHHLVTQIVEATDCRPSQAREALRALRYLRDGTALSQPIVPLDEDVFHVTVGRCLDPNCPSVARPHGHVDRPNLLAELSAAEFDHPVRNEYNLTYQNRITGKVVMVAPENDFIPEKPGDWVMLSQTPPMRRITVPAGQTPLEDRPGKPLSHPLVDVFSEGQAAFKSGGSSPYHGHSLEHCVHAWGWVSADLRAALDEAKARIVALEADDRGNGTAAARDVLAERHRQVNVEGLTPEHDDKQRNGELAAAAACYAHDLRKYRVASPLYWPWSEEWWKPTDRRRDLVKAGALIIAEIERLDRRAEKWDDL